MRWFQPLLDIVKDLDHAVDNVASLMREHVAPTVQDAAARLDGWIEESGRGIKQRAEASSVTLDDRWQRFMVQRVDPLFGQARTQHLDEMGNLAISPQEVVLNRRIAYTGLSLLAIVVGGALYPPSLALTVPISFTMVLPAYEMALQSVQKHRRVTYHVVSALNVTWIWLGGYYTPAIAATLFFYTAEKLLMVTQDRSQKGLISVFSKQPQALWVLRDGVEVEQPFDAVVPGDVVVLLAGGYIPVDGTIVDGIASIDQQMLTGEAQPIEKTVGDTVYASTLVLGGSIHVRVDKAGNETVAAKIGEVLNKTASYQLELQSRGSKLAHDAALPTLAVSGLALATVGPAGGLAALNSSFGVTVRVSAPITMLNLLNIASENAILLKDGRSLELLADVDTVLFDKTGTLTISQPTVSTIHCVGEYDAERVLALAAAAEHRQTHPIALAILAAAEERGIALVGVDDARYEVGYGIRVELDERTILVGSDRFIERAGISVPPYVMEQRASCYEKGHSLIMVACDGALAGAIELRPTVRPEVEDVLVQLRARGLKLMIISGDQEEPTRRLAEALRFDRYFANVLPEGKADLVTKLQEEGHAVCFVGDGINDSIALKRANVSVSLRGATTVATDSAQVVLMQESLQRLPFLFELSDDMEKSLTTGNTAGMLPGAVNVAGVFFAGWGFYHSLVLNMISMTAAMGIAMYPRYKHRKLAIERKNGEVPPSEVSSTTESSVSGRALPVPLEAANPASA